MLENARNAWRTDPVSHWLTLLLIVALGAAIRIVHVNQPMRYDEAWMVVNYASRPLRVVLSDYALPNNHIFHTLLVWFSTRVMGYSAWVVRLPTLIGGILLITAVYAVTRRLSGRDAGLLAAALAASLPSLVLYSTNARGYVIICLAFVLLLLLATAILEHDTVQRWAALSVLVALGAYTAPVMIYPAGVVALWMIAERIRNSGSAGLSTFAVKLVAAFALAGVLTLVAYSPVIAASGVALLVSNRFVTPVATTRFVSLLPAFIGDLRATLDLGVSAALGGVLVVAAIIAVALPREGRARRATLMGAATIWCVFVLVVTRRPPPARVWLFLVPLGCIVAGSGVAMLMHVMSARRLVAATSLLLCLGIATHTYRQRIIFDSPETNLFGLRDAEQIARFSLASLRPGDQLVAVGLTTAPLEYYLLAIAGRRLDDVAAARKSGRILVVVNQRRHQTFASVTERRSDVPWNAFAPPGLLRQFSDVSVYEVTMPALVVNDTSAANHQE